MVWSLWLAPGSLCVVGKHTELKALCHQYYRDVRSALTLLYFQQIPLNTKLIPCDWLWLSMLHCSSSPFVRLVSCTQTKLSCHSGQYSAARCFDNPHKVGIFDFFPGKKKKDKGRPLMFEPNVLNCAYTTVHSFRIKNSSKIVFCVGSVVIFQHKHSFKQF